MTHPAVLTWQRVGAKSGSEAPSARFFCSLLRPAQGLLMEAQRICCTWILGCVWHCQHRGLCSAARAAGTSWGCSPAGEDTPGQPPGPFHHCWMETSKQWGSEMGVSNPKTLCKCLKTKEDLRLSPSWAGAAHWELSLEPPGSSCWHTEPRSAPLGSPSSSQGWDTVHWAQVTSSSPTWAGLLSVLCSGKAGTGITHHPQGFGGTEQED